MQDMTPRDINRGEKSIRNIPVPPGHKLIEPMYEEDFSDQPPRRAKPKRRFVRTRFFWILIAVVVICAVAGLLMSTYFAGATVTVTPRSAQVAVPSTIQAEVNAPAGTLPYQIITSSRTASTSVPASGTKQVSLSASGVITIYNNYSTASQDLVATTRFEAPNGKIYRIHTGVTIPGAKQSSSGALTPGTVTATVYADQPGSAYNLTSATQFTIPGFEGTPKYTKFYATAPSISGGLVGLQPAVSETDLANAEQALKQGLSGAMNDMVQTQVPKQYIAIPGTLNVVYDDIVQTPGTGSTAILSQTANATADVVASEDLASAIAAQTVQGYGGEAVNFADPTQISIALASTSSATGVITLNLSGNPTLVWQFDPSALQQALLGKPKSEFETILKSFAPAISCSTATPCKASIRPFWTSTFPSDASKIKVITGN